MTVCGTEGKDGGGWRKPWALSSDPFLAGPKSGVLQKNMQMETVDYIELVRGMHSVENDGFCLWKTLKDTGHEAEVVDSE